MLRKPFELFFELLSMQPQPLRRIKNWFNSKKKRIFTINTIFTYKRGAKKDITERDVVRFGNKSFWPEKRCLQILMVMIIVQDFGDFVDFQYLGRVNRYIRGINAQRISGLQEQEPPPTVS